MKTQICVMIIVIMLSLSIMPAISSGQAGDESFTFAQYNDYMAVKGRLEYLTAEKPGICKMVIIGQTFEGRDIMAVRLTDNPDIEEPGETDVLISVPPKNAKMRL